MSQWQVYHEQFDLWISMLPNEAARMVTDGRKVRLV